MFKEYHFPYNMITLSGKIIAQSAIPFLLPVWISPESAGWTSLTLFEVLARV
jgi:hypothetical protein